MKKNSYEWLAQMLVRESGLVIGDGKHYLLEARLAPLVQATKAEDIDGLVDLLKKPGNKYWVADAVDAMTTNETSFFRDNKPFDVLYKAVIPKLMEARKDTRALRIWSAVCSTGQEPYSILMGLDQRVPASKSWDVDTLATDLSRQSLDRAQAGVYSQFEVQRGLPVTHLVKYFYQDGKNFRVKPELVSRVEFKKRNLKDPFTTLGEFDIIFCRNVLIYFDAETKKNVLERLSRVLAPDGFLFLGGGETVLGCTNKIHRVVTPEGTVYSNSPGDPVVT